MKKIENFEVHEANPCKTLGQLVLYTPKQTTFARVCPGQDKQEEIYYAGRHPLKSGHTCRLLIDGKVIRSSSLAPAPKQNDDTSTILLSSTVFALSVTIPPLGIAMTASLVIIIWCCFQKKKKRDRKEERSKRHERIRFLQNLVSSPPHAQNFELAPYNP